MLHTSTTSGAMEGKGIRVEGKGIRVTHHRVKRNEFRLASGAALTVEYWIDPTAVNVAAFDADGHQASTAVYSAYVDEADHLSSRIQEVLIDSMANALEYDLINKPELCLRKH